MNHYVTRLCLTFGLTLSVAAGFSSTCNAQTFQSTNNRTQLLELYSSQGCSSCPPAEHWVSKQLDHPGLWQEFIPIVFHVDYWDYLGWKDPFSMKQYSQRQRTYHSQGGISSVYTPGMLVNGKEWRGWYRGNSLPGSHLIPGVLSAVLDNSNLQVNYSHKAPLNLNIALLGFGIKTNVQHGENAGRTFIENFVVVDKKTVYSKNGQWNLPIKTTSQFNAQRYALAIWINSVDNLQPLQVTGGWIEP